MGELTNKQRAFIEEYLKDFNATRAAERAGYGGNYDTLRAIGSENLTKPVISERVKERLQELKVTDRQQVATRRKGTRARFVYLVEAENGLIKIGKASNIERRLKMLNSISPIDHW